MYLAVGFGVLLGVSGLVFKVRDGSHPIVDTVLGATGGFLFLAAGAVAHARRPMNRVGLLMVLVGVGFFAEDLQLSRTPVIYTAGLLLTRASSGFATRLVLAFPSGRLASRAQRLLVAAAYATVFGLPLVAALFFDSRQRPIPIPNLLLVADNLPLTRAVNHIEESIGAAIGVGVLVVLVRRWVTASRPLRRVLAPVFLTALVGAAATVAGGAVGSADPRHSTFLWVYWVAFCLLPLAFLGGVLRVQLGRTAVGDLLGRLREPLSPADLQRLLARSLGDPSLRVGYWRPESEAFIDGDGRPLRMPENDAERAVWPVERDGRRVAALFHDPALREDPHRLEAMAAAAGLALDNQRLAAEVRAQLAEVRASRMRIVAAADAERRRLERDLHDGAQQRLVVARLLLRLAQERLDGTVDEQSTALLARSADGLDAAMDELRALARGIHPAILTDAGLLPALRALTEQTPLDVRLTATAVPVLTPAVEATCYFVVAEALTNALKYAHADQVRIDVEHADGRLRVEVTDNGIGGADITAGAAGTAGATGTAGTGLLGLRDRLSALDGMLTVHSPAGHGTIVRALLPTGDPQ
ncbi:histidine kinase [Protofrankia sp. BMG5.30]|nr:histidine kinase [Protofrankia sp. BMG5.30]